MGNAMTRESSEVARGVSAASGASRRGIQARPAGGHRRGFTLIEAAVATSILGLGVVALMVAAASGTRLNHESEKLTQAVFLAQELRELTLKLPFSDQDPGDMDNPPGPDGSDPQVFVDDLDDLMDVTYAPPRNGEGAPIPEMADWSETLTLTWRDPSSLTAVVDPGTSDMIYVQVVIYYQGREVLTAGWLVARRN